MRREIEIEPILKEEVKLFRSIVVSPNEKLRRQLISTLETTGLVAISRIMDHYPTSIDLVRTLRAHATEVLFVDFESIDKALEIVLLLEHEASHVQIVAVHTHMDPAVLQQSMRAGVREFLTQPFGRQAVIESLAQIKSLLERHPVSYVASNQIISFLPSKAGAGASTIALNMSAALARKPDTKVLLTDFDLNSGMMRFMLKLQNHYSVLDALERSDEMDENLWPQMVTSIEGIDVIHAGGVRPNLRIEPTQVRNLVAFARRQYQALCFDLSGNLEKYSIELMYESKHIVMVCTPEIPSLHLAREKLSFLRDCELADRVSIVVNRMHKNSEFSKQEVEELLGQPVASTFSNDYHRIKLAMTEGTVVAEASPIGKDIAAFADAMLQHPQPQLHNNKRTFLGNFFMPAQMTPSRSMND
jgi:pilus assembly protein CpaE